MQLQRVVKGRLSVQILGSAVDASLYPRLFLFDLPAIQASYWLILRFLSEMSAAMQIVSRDAFRGIFAFYAARAHHDHKLDGEDRLIALFASSRDISDDLLSQWSDRVDALGSAAVGDQLRARAYDVIRGNVNYDHASQFLHTVIFELGQKQP